MLDKYLTRDWTEFLSKYSPILMYSFKNLYLSMTSSYSSENAAVKHSLRPNFHGGGFFRAVGRSESPEGQVCGGHNLPLPAGIVLTDLPLPPLIPTALVYG